MARDPRLAHGLAAFNAGEFFQAHEIWEELWVETVGSDKLVLQGLIQVAAGYLKVESGIRGGAMKLLTKGVEQLRQFGAMSMGLALEPFVDGVRADLQRIQAITNVTISLDIVDVPELRPT